VYCPPGRRKEENVREVRDVEFQPDPKKIALVGVGIVIVVAIVLAVSGSFYTIPPDSKGVVLRFGSYHETTLPGLHGKIPFGVDEVAIIPVKKVETMEFGFHTVKAGRRSEYISTQKMDEEKLMLTGDLNMAAVEWVIQYKISSAKDFLFNVEDVKDTIRDVSFAVMNRLVGDRSVDETITTGREDLAREARKETQRRLDDYGCGIEILALTLQNATPPEPVKAAFEDVNAAQQDSSKIINQALAKKNELIPAAKGQKARKIAEANGYSQEKVLSASGRANALLAQYAEYEKRPRETRLRLFMETMEIVYQKAGRKIIIDPDVKGVLPFLDLGSGSRGGTR
jgi:membrane protease subunit HflK